MMSVAHLDLNLLRLLLAINDAGSVSQAGQKLGLSQPAASNALARLRATLGDPLFVRSRTGMVPTAYTERIVPVVRVHLAGLSNALSDAMGFDPATRKRTFRLSLSGLGEQMFLPTLSARIAEEAPQVSLENISAPMHELPRVLSTQEADVAIGIIGPLESGLQRQHLFDEVYCVVGNPALSDADARNWRKRRIIVVAPSATYADDLETLLARHGLASNVTYRLRHFGGLPDMLRLVDAVAIVPDQLATRLEQVGAARRLPAELPLGRHAVNLVWHRKSDNDPGCVWLRGLISELFENR